MTVSLFASFALSVATSAQPIRVADLNTTTFDPSENYLFPTEFVAIADVVYFTADDGLHGDEIWRTDGTTAGTRLVRDLCPGLCSSIPHSLTAWNGRVYFRADDGAHGSELWATDGTASGTVQIADLVPGLAASYAAPLAALPAALIFSARDADHGYELWATDGTASGTARIADINPGAASSSPSAMLVIDGRFYFSANDGAHGFELWRTDGTPAGTHLVRDIAAGPASSLQLLHSVPGIAHFAALGDRLLFAADDGAHGSELWASDGTEAGTVLVADIDPSASGGFPANFLALGSRLFFRANDGFSRHGPELWASDGTTAGTSMVIDLLPGFEGSNPYELTAFGGALYFHADDGVHGRELWRSDGTAPGTAMVADLQPGGADGFHFFYTPHRLTEIGGALVFFADDGVHGNELWRSDGSAAGTVLLADLNPGPASADFGSLTSMAQNPTVVAGQFYFRAFADPIVEGRQLFATDGTTAGSRLVRRLNEQTSSTLLFLGHPLFFDDVRGLDTTADLDGRLLTQATDGTSGLELAMSDGTSSGTAIVADLVPGTGGSSPRQLTSIGSKALFVAFDPTHGTELFATDGTSAGTEALLDLDPTSSLTLDGAQLLRLGSRVLFSANDGLHGFEPWASDGTVAGTLPITDLLPGPTGSAPHFHATLADKAFFSATHPTLGYELWATDGTAAGTALVQDIAPGPSSSAILQAVAAADRALGPALFFVSGDSTTGWELWISDGTSTGTHSVKDVGPGAASGIDPFPPDGLGQPPRPVLALAGPDRVVFVADDGASGAELWISDGTEDGTARIVDLVPGAGSPEPRWLTTVGSRVVFVAGDPVHGRELWVTDGTAAGTALLADLWPGPESSVPLDFKSIGGAVLFSADDGVAGRELWITDGTAAGTRRVADIAPGPLPSSPLLETPVGSEIFFVATDGATGFEFWRLGRAGLGARLRATKSAAGRFVPNGVVIYTIVIENEGPGGQLDAPGPELVDLLPNGLVVESASATSGTVSTPSVGEVDWSGEVPAGAAVTITIAARIPSSTASGTRIANQATLHFDGDADLVSESTGLSDDPSTPGGGDSTAFTVGLGYYTLLPCRLFDSRLGEPLLGGFEQVVPVRGVCGVPPTAQAVAHTLTAIDPNAVGFLRIFTTATTPMAENQVFFRPGQTRTANGIASLGANGSVTVGAGLPFGGVVDFALDVVGWFE